MSPQRDSWAIPVAGTTTVAGGSCAPQQASNTIWYDHTTHPPQPLFGVPAPSPYDISGRINECAVTHEMDPDLVEYIDGVVASYCTKCRQRFTIARVPGGVSMLKVKALLGSVMGLDEESAKTPDFNISEMLGLFNECRDALDEEERALRQARKLVDLAGQILNQKVLAGGRD